MTEKKSEIKKVEKKVTELVLARVKELTAAKALDLPPEYSAGNALKTAELLLTEAKDKNGKPVLESCTKGSIANALLKMVVSGLSPIKSQCYFIPYGSTLNFQPSYHGRLAWAKRIGLKNMTSNIIYEGDDFKFSKDPSTGITTITKHDQEFGNIDIDKITGAYAIYEMEDGTKDAVIMTIAMIKKAWLQGATKGGSPAHKNFTDMMAEKTVIGRACSAIINRSTDSYLFEGVVKGEDIEDIKQGENETSLEFDDAEIVEDSPLGKGEPAGEGKGKPEPSPAKPEPEPKNDQAGMDQAALEFEQQEMQRQENERNTQKP